MRRERGCDCWAGLGFASLVGLLLGSLGCQDAGRAPVDPEVLAHYREVLLLSEEPAQPQHVSAVAESLEGPQEIVVIGRPGGGGAESPWEPGRARFLLADCSQDGKTHHHHEGDHSDCPFCKKAALDAQKWAVVDFQDELGETVAVDARDLFEIGQDTTVVVRGVAAKDAAGVLTVRGAGLYVRR